MDRGSIKDLLKEVLGPNVVLIDHSQWVSLHCPFAPWTHVTGADRNPSAGISIKEDDISIFNCLTCHTKLPLARFLEELSEFNGKDYEELIDQLEHEEFFGGDLKPWGQTNNAQTRTLGQPLDANVYLDLYDPAGDHWYLRKRHIDADTGERLGLLVDPSDSGGEERILFPVYHHKGGFYGFTGRATREGVYPPVRDYHGLPKEFLLLGSHLIPEDADYVVLVEGLFDQAKLFQYGVPVVAYMGGQPTKHQMEALVDIGLPVYFFRDNDITGQTAQENIKESILCKSLPVMKIRYPDRKVRGKDGSLRSIGDPDELWPEEVEKMIKDARLL